MNEIKNVFEVLENSFVHFPNHKAICDEAGDVTYQELHQDVNSLASALISIGIGRGDKVIVCLPNWREFIVIYFALAKIGAVLIPGNPSYQNDEWDNILRSTDVAAVFCAKFDKISEYHEKLIAENLMGKIKQIITVRFSLDNLTDFNSLLAMGKKQTQAISVSHEAEQVFALLFTSGSTGAAKSVMLTHDNFIYSAKNVVDILQCTPQDNFLVPVPFSHVFGLIPGILSVIMVGGKIVLMEKFHTAAAIELIHKENITVHYGVPTMFILEMNHASASSEKFASLRTGLIAGSPCPEQVIKKIRSFMGCNIIVSYGATETSAGVTYTSFEDSDEIHAKTVGKAVAGTEVKIVNQQREMVPNGVVGELACRGKGIMKGYASVPPDMKQAAIDEDGWFYTGDLGLMDDAGYVMIAGRKKDMIIRGGYNIYPCEIEEILYNHPYVAQVSVVGIPHPIFGEATCAVIKLTADHPEAPEEMFKDFVRDKVSKYKVPDYILFVKTFPLSQTGKVNKKALRELCNAHFAQSMMVRNS